MTTIPFDVKTSFDRSEPLDDHIRRRLATALRAHAQHLRRVEVRLSDVNGPRQGAHDKVASIGMTLKPKGTIVASAAASDLYLSVSRAAMRAGNALARHAQRFEQRGRRPVRRGPGADEAYARG